MTTLFRSLFRASPPALAVLCLIALVGVAGANAQVITVNTTLDDGGLGSDVGDGACSLREAINNANLVAGGDVSGLDCDPGQTGLDTIEFDIPPAMMASGGYTISLTDPDGLGTGLSGQLPKIVERTFIDGLSQSDASGTPPSCDVAALTGRRLFITLDGTGTDNEGFLQGGGVWFGGGASASNSVVQGLQIINFANYGIHVDLNAAGVTIQCNNVGVTPDPAGPGTIVAGNGNMGVFVDDADNSIIGGPGALGNVIAGNGAFELNFRYRGGHTAVGNYLGVSPFGTSTEVVNSNVSTDFQTVVINAGATLEGNVIGGPRNLVTAFSQATPVTLSGNYIGADPASADLGGSGFGLSMSGSIGVFDIDGNTIRNTGSNAIQAAGDTRGEIQGNTIGDNNAGIRISSTGDWDILGNTIRDNTGIGVSAASGSSSGLIEGNSVAGNSQGIEISSAGAWDIRDNTVNDNDGDGLRRFTACLTTPCEISGNLIHGNGVSGIYLEEGADGYTITGNWVGLNDAGVKDGNLNGMIVRSGGNQIGGNTISGNVGIGLQLASPRSTGNLVTGNFIGTNETGTAAIPNDLDGVEVTEGAYDNVIGGSQSGRNIISGNLGQGVSIMGNLYGGVEVAQGNTISHNFIGVAANGLDALANGGAPNRGHGVFVFGEAGQPEALRPFGNVIDNNLISANLQDGIMVLFAGSGNEITNNIIGAALDGITPLSNGWNGVDIIGSQTGGHSIVTGNTVAYNPEAGILLKDEGENPPFVSATILGNSTFQNGGSGIDLTHTPGTCCLPGDGLTPNDFDDSDDGPNTLLNFPVLERAEGVHSGDGRATSITVRMRFSGPGPYLVELFAADRDNEEGTQLVGSETLTGPFNEAVELEFAPPSGSLPLGTVLVATASVDDGSGNWLTSEFSRPVTVDDYVPRGYASNIIGSTDFGGVTPRAIAVTESGDYLVSLDGDITLFDAAGSTSLIDLNLSPSDYVSDIVTYGAAPEVVVIHTEGVVSKVHWLGESTVNLDGAVAGDFSPDGTCLYVAADFDVQRACGTALQFESWATLSNPITGLAFAPTGELYVGQSDGSIRLLPESNPGAGELVWTLENQPTSMDFAEDGRLFISTISEVLSGLPGDPGPTQFLPIPDNTVFPNSLSVGPRSQVFVVDEARGELLVMGLAANQAQADLTTLEFRVSAEVLDMLSDRVLIHEAVENAISSWQTEGSFTGHISYDRLAPEGVRNAAIGDDENTIALSQDRLYLGSSTLGVASKLLEIPEGGDVEDAIVIKADILLNERFHPVTGTSGELGVFASEVSSRDHDVQGILTHEFGHVLGLIHSGRPDATMFYNLPRDARHLTVDDKAAILRKVGADPATMARITGQVISGNVDSPPDTPVGGALVIATDEDGESIHAYTDRDGNYDLSFLPPGTYDVGLFALDGSVFNTRIPLVPARISRYLDVIANERDFLEEYWSGVGLETSTDVRSESVPVVLGPATAQGGVDFVTNIDLKPPTVLNYTVGTDPSAASLDPTVGITFSERIKEAPLATVRPVGCAAVGCTEEQTLEVIFDKSGGKFAVASTDDSLQPETAYVITVTGMVDLADNPQTTASTFIFTTRPPDTTPPELVSSTPDAGETEVGLFSLVTASFSEALSADAISGAVSLLEILAESEVEVPGKVSLPATNVVAFSPSQALSANSTYRFELTVEDAAGNATSESIEFATESNPTLAITARGPAEGSVGVALGTNVYVDFNEAVAEMPEGYPVALSIPGISGEKGDPLPGSTQLVDNGKRLVFIPTSILDSGQTYRFDIEAGLLDASTGSEGVPVESWTFTSTSTTTVQSLEGLSPSVGAVGSYVTVVGSGFTPIVGANTVYFNAESGMVQGDVVAAVDNGIVVRVPEGTVSGTVSVNGETLLGNGLGQLQFSVYEAPQTFDTGTTTAETESNPGDVEVSPDGTLAVVPNAGSNTVSLINIETGETETVLVERTPLRVAISPDGERAYVTNYNSNTVSVIDLGCAVGGGANCIESIPVEFNPIGIDVAPDGSRIYVGNYTSRTISIIDTSSPESETYNQTVRKLETEELVGKVVTDPDGAEKLGTESNPTHVEAHPDGTGIWIGTLFGVIAAEVNLDTDPANWGVTILVTEEAAGSVKASPDGGVTILVTEGNAGSTNQDPDGAGTIAETESTAGHVKSSPDGSVVAFTMGTGEVLIYAVPDNPFGGAYQAVAKIDSEANAGQVEMSPDGGLIYVTSFETGTVSIYRFGRGLGSADSDPIQVSGSEYGVVLIEVKEVGLGPDGIAYSAVNDLAVVANSGSDDLTILRFDGQTGFSVALEQEDVAEADADGDGIDDIRSDIVDELSALTAGSDDKDQKDFENALKAAEKNLDTKLWNEDGTPSENQGHKVFDNDKKIIKELLQVIDRDNLWREVSEDLIQVLLDLDHRLAQDAIDKAQADIDAAVADCDLEADKKKRKKCEKQIKSAQKRLEDALKEMAKAQEHLDNGKPDKAIDQYKKAWKHATKSSDAAAGKGFWEDEDDLPVDFELSQNYPNPFNPITTIEFALPEMAEVRLEVFDVLGRRVQQLVNGQMDAGYHSIQFNAERLASGIYLYRIQAGAYTKVHRMVMMK